MNVTISSTSNSDCRRLSSVLGLIGDKWTVMIIGALIEQPRRFNELRRIVGGISQQMLTRTLKALERDGIVSRTVHPTVPPQVVYALTDLGLSLAVPIRALGDWARENLDRIEGSRARYDSSAERNASAGS